jgi:predicted 2-oxoglutarate/Fe(II)-dependent dioxygenase YbiX
VALRGFYNWHTDFAGLRPLRKISVSIQLSRADDYEGGDLELMYGIHPQKIERTRGTFIAFPSFMLHRVTPVTRGTRWSLVAWILGARWR